MKNAGKRLNSLLNIIIASSLAFMAVLVFGNVVLRYAFNSGIVWSEEMSRFLFIWMCFLGSIGAMRDNQHLGVDMFIKKLSSGKKKVIFTFTNLLVLYILWLILDGSWKVAVSNLHTPAPVTGLPMFYIYITGVMVSICMGWVVIRNLYRAWFVENSIEELTRSMESEEELELVLYEEKKIAQGGGM
ncbi:TRAP transporter small permease [Aneurinibacillus tyrosinisolvens]|uniref:TRAP transporter small permease n=1 Tax=Aneurinibacillus tyrosinisolvens TaxID=1443435 RepID=UPI00063F3762|nr:TRAP transporter small permease [Aneurinibacillus tyrosinisolvens]